MNIRSQFVILLKRSAVFDTVPRPSTAVRMILCEDGLAPAALRLYRTRRGNAFIRPQQQAGRAYEHPYHAGVRPAPGNPGEPQRPRSSNRGHEPPTERAG